MRQVQSQPWKTFI